MLRGYFENLTSRDWQESSAADGPIRIACIGAGFWGREEAIPAMNMSELCTPTAVVDTDPEIRREVAEEWGLIKLSPEALRAGEHADAFDAVYIATPNRTHLEYVEAAAKLDKDMLCEKPMEASFERAKRMVDVCDRKNSRLMIGYRMQTDPVVRRAKELIAEGFIGEIRHVHGHMSNPLLDLIPDPNQWRLDREIAGGCTLIDIGVYPLNTTRFLIEEDPETVQASTITEHPAFANVDEHASLNLYFPDGILASYTVSHNSYEASHLRVVGSEGEVVLEPIFFPWERRGLQLKRAGNDSRIVFEQVNQMVEEFDYFADCLLAGREPYPNGHHALVDIATIQAAYADAETPGTAIEI